MWVPSSIRPKGCSDNKLQQSDTRIYNKGSVAIPQQHRHNDLFVYILNGHIYSCTPAFHNIIYLLNGIEVYHDQLRPFTNQSLTHRGRRKSGELV